MVLTELLNAVYWYRHEVKGKKDNLQCNYSSLNFVLTEYAQLYFEVVMYGVRHLKWLNAVYGTVLKVMSRWFM